MPLAKNRASTTIRQQKLQGGPDGSTRARGDDGSRAPRDPRKRKETYKIGLVAPLTGPFTSTGKQVAAGAQFYLQQNGNTVAGKKIELLIRDDAGIADQTRRLVQELIVNDKVNAIAGFGLTPLALAAAPLATQSKTPMIVMAAATSIVTERSPYIVRTSFAQAQPVVVIGDWQVRHGMKKAVSMVSDFAPGYDSETFFKDSFTRAGGQVVEALRIPLKIRISRRSCSGPATRRRMVSSYSSLPVRRLR